MSKITWTEKTVKISDLKEFDKNPRRISEKSFKKLVDSLRQDGYHTRIKATQDNKIIGGHQRVKAMIDSGLALDDEIQILVPDRNLSKKEFERINIRDNLEFGEWDFEILESAFDIEDLKEFGLEIDLQTINIDQDINDDDTVKNLIESDEECTTKILDIHKLGNHILMCGDSFNLDHVAKLTSNNNIDMIFTDPMYNDNALGFVSTILQTNIKHILLMTTLKHAFDVIKTESLHFRFDIVLTFKTPSSTLNKKVPYYLHKNICYFTTSQDETIFNCDNAKGAFSDKGYYPSVIEAKKNTQEPHGLTKPVDAIQKILSGFNAKTVLDLFAGSGSTLMACEAMKKKCYAMEISPKYCDIIIKRWEDYTKKSAVLLN